MSTPAPLRNLLQFFAAQEQANQLAQQAREDDRRVRIEASSAKFPYLKSLTQDSVDDWYQNVLLKIKGPKYNTFYDPLSNDLVPNGVVVDVTLNTTLYNELLTTMTAPIQRYVQNRQNLHNDGVLLLQDLQSTFNQLWSTVERDTQERI